MENNVLSESKKEIQFSIETIFSIKELELIRGAIDDRIQELSEYVAEYEKVKPEILLMVEDCCRIRMKINNLLD